MSFSFIFTFVPCTGALSHITQSIHYTPTSTHLSYLCHISPLCSCISPQFPYSASTSLSTVLISHYMIYILPLSIIHIPIPPQYLIDCCAHIPTTFTSPPSFASLVLPLPLSPQLSGLFMTALPLSMCQSWCAHIYIHLIMIPLPSSPGSSKTLPIPSSYTQVLHTLLPFS